ncbi:hypothetical protein Lepto7376_2305 [[Leptolyngbya] sp. PCC 7376]|uniref:hypothetical protein n=1 Tax=[Leptolyngbya] sp. PCC 7376 TaxID=111781 RepID=UPI00029ED1AC|nr:hypothetical protein [[Leptolyngbya] sp. PCC 7376]AFY38595.1 hypothetical protein Lepto7376_2305 [[Leptolyngbya] sp. PCC 7376]
MLLSRRQTHLAASSILAIALPLILLFGFIFRPQYLPSDESAQILFEQDGYALVADSELGEKIASEDLGKSSQFNAITYTQEDDKVILTLKPRWDLRQPDLLIYWDGAAEAPEEIGDSALLLGRLSGSAQRQFSVPDAIVGKDGYLLIYSQGRQAIQAAFPISASLTQL